jgi:type II secretory pathway pseudopilin PulG
LKKGIVLLEIILSLAIFLAVALPILSLSIENFSAARYTQQREKSIDVIHNSLEAFFGDGCQELVRNLGVSGQVEDEYLHLDINYKRKWQHLNFSEKDSPMQICLTLNWRDRIGNHYESDITFVYNQKEGVFTP